MKKYLFYLMKGEKMCALHALMNAKDLAEANEVKIIFEGQSVKLPAVFAEEGNPLYKKLLEEGRIAGVCKGCAKALGALEEVEALGLPLLQDMNGHAGMKPYVEEGFEVIVF